MLTLILFFLILGYGSAFAPPLQVTYWCKNVRGNYNFCPLFDSTEHEVFVERIILYYATRSLLTPHEYTEAANSSEGRHGAPPILGRVVVVAHVRQRTPTLGADGSRHGSRSSPSTAFEPFRVLKRDKAEVKMKTHSSQTPYPAIKTCPCTPHARRPCCRATLGGVDFLASYLMKYPDLSRKASHKTHTPCLSLQTRGGPLHVSLQ